MRLIIEPDYAKVSEWAANYVASRINEANPTAEKPFVLGCPTGSSPLGMYKHLIELNKAGKVSFEHVVTFNMDEYCGLPEEHPESYHSFMWNNFFSHINIKKENVNILNGNAEDLDAECRRYEEKIASYGGIDLFLGGVGPDGHIAFNEPGTPFGSVTHIVDLTESTIKDNSRLFKNIDEVPRQAFTMGLKNIMNAKKILILANGANKAKAVYGLVKGEVTENLPASVLQLHPDCTLVCDEAAAELL